MKFLLYAVAGLAALLSIRAQTIAQCTCKDVEACKKSYVDAIWPCADACAAHAAKVGANYKQLRSCIMEREPQLRQVLKCAEKSLGNTCASAPGQTVPKRFIETLKLAGFTEVDHILKKSGVLEQVKHLVKESEKFYTCIKSCMDDKANNCAKKLSCGLQLPPDNVIVKNFKQCAIENGFDNKGTQTICECGTKSGIKELESVCGKLQIS
ncbi:hypothetical protein M3Y97_01057300 [Aphelenchoides bicaudatus]|nr:hypothetical protein M3Y97_01057300 [Aphelenchoides bicaudatus]